MSRPTKSVFNRQINAYWFFKNKNNEIKANFKQGNELFKESKSYFISFTILVFNSLNNLP